MIIYLSERAMFDIAWCLEIGFVRVPRNLVWRFHGRRNMYGAFH